MKSDWTDVGRARRKCGSGLIGARASDKGCLRTACLVWPAAVPFPRDSCVLDMAKFLLRQGTVAAWVTRQAQPVDPPQMNSSAIRGDGQLGGKVAWVTGGATGIGQSAARMLAEQGASVAISGRRDDALERTAAMLRDQGLDVTAYAVDVSDAAAVARVAARIRTERGMVSVLVCSAGTNVPNRFWRDSTAKSFAAVVAINLQGAANCVRAVLPTMRERGDGVIAVVSSWSGRHYLPFTGAAYGASKMGLAPLVESINIEEGRHGVRASLIMPGEVATPILKTRPVPPSDAEMNRMLRPDDVADVIRYVATAPAHVCINEVLVGPTWNRIYLGAEDLRP